MPPTKRTEAEKRCPELATLLRVWRSNDVPLAEIAWRLRTDHDIHVTAETVRKWCDPAPTAPRPIP